MRGLHAGRSSLVLLPSTFPALICPLGVKRKELRALKEKSCGLSRPHTGRRRCRGQDAALSPTSRGEPVAMTAFPRPIKELTLVAEFRDLRAAGTGAAGSRQCMSGGRCDLSPYLSLAACTSNSSFEMYSPVR